MDNQPKLMNYARMKGVFDAHMEQMFKYAFINSELGMLYGDPSMFKLIIQQHKPPFIINDFRMGLIAYVRIPTSTRPACRFRAGRSGPPAEAWQACHPQSFLPRTAFPCSCISPTRERQWTAPPSSLR